MNETLDEFLKHFVGKSKIDYFYITNITDDIEDKYDLDELSDYGRYDVVEWEFNLWENKLFITIEW